MTLQRPHRHHNRRATFRPSLECLEGRWCPSRNMLVDDPSQLIATDHKVSRIVTDERAAQGALVAVVPGLERVASHGFSDPDETSNVTGIERVASPPANGARAILSLIDSPDLTPASVRVGPGVRIALFRSFVGNPEH